MINDVVVRFTNGNDVDAERVKFKDGGWVGVRGTDGWVYYPPQHIDRIVNPDANADAAEVEA